MSQKVSFGPANFYFWQPRRNFSDKASIKILLLSKNNGKVYILKIISSLKCSNGHVECSFNKPAKKVDMMPKTSAQCLKMIKIFLVFENSFFFKKRFDRHGECSFERPAKLLLLKYQKWSEKSQQKMQKLFENFSCKTFHGEVESNLKAPLTFTDS